MLYFLDIFFTFFHTAVVLFNLFGWLWKKTRKYHLILVFLTLFSWFFLGIWYGFGYCFCTDWHWQVREAMGYKDMPYSYIQFLAERLTGILPPLEITEQFTLIFFLAAVILSIVFNFLDWKKSKRLKDRP
ncbi:MAG: hypothetical protein A2Y41_14295 [Spirochaetes bacterium GWB1_36_13]|nr:MAG: hypothetical protein A2Y41_14295 [Spirochaetes bacterium GWB1_36_13]